MRNYLKNRKERVNVNSRFSEWEAIFTFVPQGSILGILLFNIFLNDLFLVVTHSHLNGYVDDITLHCFGTNINQVSDKLKIDLAQVMEWFYKKYMHYKYRYVNML